MRICIPTQGNNGLKEMVYDHFGSAPFFAVYDTDKEVLNFVQNDHEHHEHGACQPLNAIAALNVEAVLAGGMGSRAVALLNQGGIKVFKLNGNTVSEALHLFKIGKLDELTAENACGHHGGCH